MEILFMKKLNTKEYKEIENCVNRNARFLEKALWDFNFENGNIEPVLHALKYYQNEDGGFGNALEPDNWNPESTPYTTLFALNILLGINFFDMEHPLFKGIISYFSSGAYMTEYGWKFSIQTNDNYPHAPWWTYNEKDNITESLGITAEISAFVLQYINPSSQLYSHAYKYSSQLINKMLNDSSFGEMGLGGFIVLSDALEKLNISQLYTSELQQLLDKLVSNSIEYDQSKWPYHVVKPSRYIKSPKSRYYFANEEIVGKELDYLIETRPANGIWEIDWSWFKNNEKYAKEFAIAENWWKCYQAIDILKYLREFDRLYS